MSPEEHKRLATIGKQLLIRATTDKPRRPPPPKSIPNTKHGGRTDTCISESEKPKV